MLNIFYDRIAAFSFFCPDRNMGKYVLTRKKLMESAPLIRRTGDFYFGEDRWDSGDI